MIEQKTFWLSFCDAERPKGSQFLGACLVSVTREEAARAALEIAIRFSRAQEGAEWIGAAIRKAHELQCNPGGEVASLEVPPDHQLLTHYPIGVLMDRATIRAIDDQIAKAAKGTDRASVLSKG